VEQIRTRSHSDQVFLDLIRIVDPADSVKRSHDLVAELEAKLTEAFPESRQIWLPLGHYSALLHLVWIPRFVSKDLQKNLK
jgi:hypothetical protein